MRRKALIVEECVTMSKTLAVYLLQAFDCVECHSVMDVSNQIHLDVFDFILLSMHNHDKTKLHLLKILREHQRNAKILVMTTRPSLDLIQAVHLGGADSMLVKPFEAKNFYSKVDGIFEENLLGIKGKMSDMAELFISFKVQGPYAILELVGRLVESTCVVLRKSIQELVKKGKIRILLDCERLLSIDASAIRFLEDCAIYLKSLSGILGFIGASHIIKWVIENPTLKEIVKVFKAESEVSQKLIVKSSGMAYPELGLAVD